MRNISCKFCPYGFLGDVVCMTCAAGFSIEEPNTWSFSIAVANPNVAQTLPTRNDLVGRSFPLKLIFQLETSRVGTNTRWKINRDIIETGLLVRLVAEVGATGNEDRLVGYQTTELSCPCCSEQTLKYFLDRPDYCPQCKRKGLSRSISF